MLTQFGKRTILNSAFAAAAVASLCASSAFAQPAAPRTPPATPGTGTAPPVNVSGTVANPLLPPGNAPAGGAPGAADSTTSSGGKQQTPIEWLIGGAVADPNSAQYKVVADAIEKFQKGGLTEAREQLSQARKNDSKIPPAEILIARLFALAGQVGPARGELERAVVAAPKDPEPYLLFAEVALQDRRITDAESLLLKAKAIADGYSENPKRKANFDIRVNAGLAAVAEARSQWESALQYLQEWIKLEPKNASARQRIGRTLFQLGKLKEATNELNESVKLDSNAVNPYIFMAQLYEEAKQHTDAKNAINIAVRGNPKDVNVHLLAAKWALATNEMKDAQAFAEAAGKIDDKSVDAKVVGGTIARMTGDMKKAEDLLRKAMVEAPANLDASNQLALVLVESSDAGKQKQAVDIAKLNAQATTQGNQFSPEAFTTLAWVLYKTGNVQEAAKVMQQVLSTQRLSQDGAYYLACILADQKDNERAMAVLEQAINTASPFAQRDAAVELQRKLKAEKTSADNAKK